MNQEHTAEPPRVDSAVTAPLPEGTRRAVAAAAIGNLLESYDFAVYGFFAATIAPLFFPTGNPTSSLLLGVATFGVGFFMRPVGAIVHPSPRSTDQPKKAAPTQGT